MWERPSFEVWMIDLLLKSIVGFFSLSSLKKQKNMEIIALDRVQAALCPFRHQMGISVHNCRSMLGYLSSHGSGLADVYHFQKYCRYSCEVIIFQN